MYTCIKELLTAPFKYLTKIQLILMFMPSYYTNFMCGKTISSLYCGVKATGIRDQVNQLLQLVEGICVIDLTCPGAGGGNLV